MNLKSIGNALLGLGAVLAFPALLIGISLAWSHFFPSGPAFDTNTDQGRAVATIRDNPNLPAIFKKRHLPPPTHDDSAWSADSEKETMDETRHWYCPNEWIVTYTFLASELDDEQWIVDVRSNKVRHLDVIAGASGGGIVDDNGRIPLCIDGTTPIEEGSE